MITARRRRTIALFPHFTAKRPRATLPTEGWVLRLIAPTLEMRPCAIACQLAAFAATRLTPAATGSALTRAGIGPGAWATKGAPGHGRHTLAERVKRGRLEFGSPRVYAVAKTIFQNEATPLAKTQTHGPYTD